MDFDHRHTPANSAPPIADKYMSVTIPVSIISDLTKGMNMANELLNKERQLTHKLWIESTDLKLKIKDLEVAITIGPNSTQNRRKDDAVAPLGTSTIAKVENVAKKDRAPSTSSHQPQANKNKNPKRKTIVDIPSESEAEENKALSRKNTPRNQNSTSKVGHARKQNNRWGNKHSQATAKVNNKERKNETKNVLIIGDSQLRKIDGVKLSNNNHNHNVTVDAMPGARIARTKGTRINKRILMLLSCTLVPATLKSKRIPKN